MKRFIITILFLSLSAYIAFAGGRRDTAVNNGRLNVVATIFPAYDFVRQIAGDRVNLTMLLSPGVESHSFEPSPRDIITINNSDVFIYTGGDMDTWIDRILRSMDTRSMRILAMMDAVNLLMEDHHEHHDAHPHHDEYYDEEHFDPHARTQHECDDDCDHGLPHFDEHVWTSPRNAIQIVRVITDTLSAADPSNAAFFRENAAAYIEELRKLDAAFSEVVAGARRTTIVFGDRFPFRYLAHDYGLTYHAAFPGCSTQTDPSPATIAFLINKVRDERIPVVFHIELSSELIANVIVEATGARKLMLHSAHNVTRQDFNAGLGYLDFMRRNIENLRIALH